MKKILLGIIKEIGIAIGIFVILSAVVVLTFKEQLPYDEEIRSAEEYIKADIKNSYSVSSSDRISEVTAITVTHEADSNQIVEAENEVRIQTGKYTPFGSISGASDLPTEKVGTTVSITTQNTNKNNNSTVDANGNNTDETLEYPVTDEAIEEIAKSESESAESAANRRFNNED